MFKIESAVSGSTSKGEELNYNEQQNADLFGEIVKTETIQWEEEIIDEFISNNFETFKKEDNDDEIKNVLLSPTTKNTNQNKIFETPASDDDDYYEENIQNTSIKHEPKAEYIKPDKDEKFEETEEKYQNNEKISTTFKELIEAMIEPCHHFPYVHLKVLTNLEKMSSSNASPELKISKSKQPLKRKYQKTKKRKYKPKVSELTCSVCNYQSPTPTYLVSHMRKHTGEKPFSCQKCLKSFTFQSNYSSHKCGFKKLKTPANNLKIRTRKSAASVLIKKKYVCPICRRIFSHPSSLDYHLKGHTGVKPYPCTLCDKTFRKPNYLKIHLVFKHSDNPEVQATADFAHYKTQVERKYYKQTKKRSAPKMKMEIKPKIVKIYDCKTCGRVLKNRATLKRHRRNQVCQKIISPPPPAPLDYKCSRCELAFADRNGRKVHETEVHGFKFICSSSSCGIGFNGIAELEFHRRLSHPDEPKIFVCEFCTLVFTTFSLRKKHILQIHPVESINFTSDPGSKKNGFECPKCVETFPTLFKLNRHEIRHGTRHSCTSCPGIFKHIVGLQFHIRRSHPEKVEITVEEEKNFKCTHCIEGFTRLLTLRRHEMTHGDDLFCAFCPGGFKSLVTLTSHKNRAHSQAIRFTCSNCPMDFATAFERKTHTEENHREITEQIDIPKQTKVVKNTFKCSKCDLNHDTNRRRNQHEASHGDKYMCHLCPSGFKSIVGLSLHQKQLHPMEAKSFICKKCGLVFESDASRYKHQVLAHDKRRKFKPPRRVLPKTIVQEEEEREVPQAILTDPLAIDQNSDDFIPKKTEEIKIEYETEEEDDPISSWVQSVTNNKETATTTDIEFSNVIPTTILKMEC